MPNLFISYRRQDSADVTGRLCDHLQTHFGREAVFVDIDSIPYGLDFRKRLEDAVSRCDVLLAVIGDHWLDAAWPEGPRQGKRRLDDPEDYVRGEIGAALDRGIPVVPVLVGRASMPAVADLPDGLKEFAYRNAAPVRSGPDFRSHVDRLIRDLEWLADKRRQLQEDIQKAIDLVDQDPEMALVRGRKVLELIVREMYARRYHEPPGPRPPESLLQRLVNGRYFPSQLGASAAAVCKLGNVGAASSSQRLTAEEVRQALIPLAEILKWYMEVEQPNAVGRQENQPLRPASHTGQSAGQSAVPVHERTKAIVPKGPRSFDAKDSDFFLDLLPGPRDKDGLPESIRFWKHRIEERDDPTFSVGVIYGPSGCGKSSLVKAGLLPRLAAGVVPVYVEATAADTEARLLKGLRKRLPGLPSDADLTGALAALRQNEGPADGQKVLLVVDQFEQWLHARRQEEDTELARALRQCDGERVQAIVLVRDDFWMALTRFLGGLNIELIQGRNAAAVDLFDPTHARAVLAAFGRAFGRLADVPTKELAAFLDQAVGGLSQDGRVICVRLALFAEMVKGKPWTPATLKAVGGTEGVGVTFLEETFSSPIAGPRNRQHQNAARSVLKALLPERGSDIKGNMRSYEELLEASGYARRPRDFEELVRILDGEVRLITPTQPPEQDAEAESPAPAVGKYYQLTHDYLIHSLRAWLTRKQRETRRGRAELRLEGLATQWNAFPAKRQLPAWWEWLNIRMLTRKRDWTAPQRKMMRRAARRHAEGAVLLALALVLLTVIGLGIQGQVNNRNRGVELVKQILDADVNRIPDLAKEVEGYRYWADPRLRAAFAEAERVGDAHRQVNAGLALLRPGAADQVDYLYGRYLDAETSEAAVIIKMLADTGHLEAEQGQKLGVLNEVVDRPLDEEKTDEDKERLAKRQANAAVALLRMGRAERVWPLLRHKPDPRVRSDLIHRLSPLGADPGAIVRRLDEEKEVSIRRALLLCLGEFGPEQLSPADREPLIPKVLQLYREDPDAGMHGAADWLLRQWGQGDKLKEIEQQWAEDRPHREGELKKIRNELTEAKGRGESCWYVNSQGQTMVVFPGPVQAAMGSPKTEAGRAGGTEGRDEAQRLETIDRSFALAAKEVTVAQFRQFLPEYAQNEPDAPTPDCPAPRLSWFEAAAYCNRLSGADHIREEQWCYIANPSGKFEEGVKMAPGFPNLDGYRLPTDAEWEYACRAGAKTSRYYGESEDLLGEYAWYINNSQGRRLAPVGRLMPNDFGLFDMLGNAVEWCQDPWPEAADATDGRGGNAEDERGVNSSRHRILRGGSFNYRAADVRAAYRDGDVPMNRYFYYGLRPARTIR